MKYVGIDVGKYKCAVAMMDSEGRFSDEFAFHSNTEGIRGLISRLSMDDMVVMESRFAQPEEIAEFVIFLLSDNASYITGQEFSVNSGLYM